MSFAPSWRGLWGFAALLLVLATFGAGGVVAAELDPAAAASEPLPSEGAEVRRWAACQLLARTRWPADSNERRAVLQRLDQQRERCIDHAAFLATLGGFWLEEGDPVQALLWLERSLLLDPSALGAQADLALALAALGDKTALSQLLREWEGRTDIPAVLLSRLVQSSGLPVVSSGSASGNHQRAWVQAREVSVMLGHESNLDRSPRLNELTITPPDGETNLPLAEPLKPRPGTATTTEMSWQGAFSPRTGSVLQVGVQASARAAPGNSDTNWHHAQLAGSASQRWGVWRADVQGSVAAVAGPLNEPYRLVRWGIALERTGVGCTQRVGLDLEARTQSVTSLADSRSVGGVINVLCSAPGLTGWTLAAALRASTDVPDNHDRAGGVQRQWSAGIRASGPIGASGRLEMSLRVSRALDSEGYSPLLEREARRWLSPVQISIEFAQPMALSAMPPTEAIGQIQALRQDSNLPIFRYSSVGLFGGLRWRW